MSIKIARFPWFSGKRAIPICTLSDYLRFSFKNYPERYRAAVDSDGAAGAELDHLFEFNVLLDLVFDRLDNLRRAGGVGDEDA